MYGFLFLLGVVNSLSYDDAVQEVRKSLPDLSGVPLQSSEEPLKVDIYFRLTRLVSIDIGIGTAVVSGVPMMKWTDPRVEWNIEEHNVSKISLSPDEIWIPDIRLLNSIGSVNDEGELTSNAILFRDGTVFYSEQRAYEFSCNLDAYLFPFDVQVLHMVFLSWTYSINELRFVPHVLKNLRPASSGYTVKEPEVKEQEVEVLLYPHSMVQYDIELVRQWSPYFLIIVAPTVLISFLSLLIFFLPVNSGEKVEFGVTIFLTLCVNSLVIAEAVPATTEKVPLITWVNSIVTAMVAGSLLAAIITTRFLQTSSKTPPLPKMLHIALYYIGIPFCVKFKKPKHSYSLEELKMSPKKTTSENSTMADILQNVKAIKDMLEGHEESDENYEEWVKVATLIDKVFTLLFIVLFIYMFAIFLVTLYKSGIFS